MIREYFNTSSSWPSCMTIRSKVTTLKKPVFIRRLITDQVLEYISEEAEQDIPMNEIPVFSQSMTR